MRQLPSGTVTFLFTDVEGSTRLLHELGAERYAQALAEHRRVLREAFERHGGVEVDTQGDAFFVVFSTALDALEAAREAQAALAVSVRMGVHTGAALLTDEGYIGSDVHKAARIAAAGHGRQILVSEATAALLDQELRDLGEHRLKDLSARERIFQVGEEDFPALKTLYRTNLPVPATPFVGRAREVEGVIESLGRTRLLTLTGPGGTGKTRLALQAAADASDGYPDGVFWVPLAPLRDPGLVIEEAAQAVGATDGLESHIADKRILLLLDNFEHVIAAAEELVPVQAACPNLRLVVTSRELLGLPGEQAYPVPPLEPGDATQFFVARARAGKPNFEADESVADLCRRLDNLPLALELAAARTRILSTAQLLERLSGRLDLLKAGRGVDARQQTLRATIEWSHELLDEDEKRLFARLAVFRGGCALEAAEAIGDADLDTLQSLVDKSLVRVRDDGRFWMLETIHEYASERLGEAGEAEALHDRHAQFFLALAEQAEPSILGVDPGEWLRRLEHEHDNIRSALDWLEQSEPHDAVRLGGALWEFWCLRGHAVEGWRRLERLIELDERPTTGRAKVLVGSAHLGPQVEASIELQARRAEQALELYRDLNDPWGSALAEWQFAAVFTERGDFASALPLVAECVGRFRAVGDEHRALQATRATAWCHLELGDLDRGIEIYRELLERARAAGDVVLQARALGFLAGIEGNAGRIDNALAMMIEAYALDCDVGDKTHVAEDLVRLSLILLDGRRADAAAQLVGRADAIHAELGLKYVSWLAEMRDEAVERARRELGDGRFAAEMERGAQLSTEDAFAFATGGS